MDCPEGTPIVVEGVPFDQGADALEGSAAEAGIEVLGRSLRRDGYVEVTSQCDARRCRGAIAVTHITTIEFLGSHGETVQSTTTHTAILPGARRAWEVDGVSLEGLTRQDVTGDGVEEVLVRYLVVEPPRPAVGSWATEWLAIVDPITGRMLFSHELGVRGGASERSSEWVVSAGEGKLRVSGIRGIRGDIEEDRSTAEVLPSACWAPRSDGRFAK